VSPCSGWCREKARFEFSVLEGSPADQTNSAVRALKELALKGRGRRCK
jgi:hypothetical protein